MLTLANSNKECFKTISKQFLATVLITLLLPILLARSCSRPFEKTLYLSSSFLDNKLRKRQVRIRVIILIQKTNLIVRRQGLVSLYGTCYIDLIDLNKSKNKSNNDFIRLFYQFCDYESTKHFYKMNVVIYITCTYLLKNK